MACFEQALIALPLQARDTSEQAIDLRLALRTALLPSGDFGRILAALHEAEASRNPRRPPSAGTGLLLSVTHFYRMGA